MVVKDVSRTGWQPAYSDPSQNPPALAALALANLPLPIQAVVQALLATRRGVRVLLVGGAVRDALLGLPVTDFDFEVYGVGWLRPMARLRRIARRVEVVGASFGVMQVTLEDGSECDVSLPRRENKAGQGSRGFEVTLDPGMTAREAASRRDFTINSAAFDPVTSEFFDFFGAERDCAARILRATSEHFGEDPARVLRGFQLASRPDGGLAMTAETAEFCRALLPEAGTLPLERIKAEWLKWALRGRCPRAGLHVLRQTGWLATVPELAPLAGCQQDPQFHPEGDVFEHTALACDAAARIAERDGLADDERLRLMLAALLHDIGKPATTRVEYEHECRSRGGRSIRLLPGEVCRCGVVGGPGFGAARILSPNHAEFAVLGGLGCARCGWERLGKGLGLLVSAARCPMCGGNVKRVPSLVETFVSRIGLQASLEPTRLLWAVSELVWQHMAQVVSGEGWTCRRQAIIQTLAERLRHTSVRQWARLAEADHLARPPLPGGKPVGEWLVAAEQYGCLDGPLPVILQGRDLVALGMAPGNEVGRVLYELRRAQIHGEVYNRADAIEWLWRRGQAAHLLRGDDLLAAGLRPGPEFSRRLRRAFEAQVSGQVTSREQALELALAETPA